MVTFKNKGNFKKLSTYFKKSVKVTRVKNVNVLADTCLQKLKEATPLDSGLTASAWSYKIQRKKGYRRITFYNSNIQNGVKIALLIEYGHVSRNGTWVKGERFIHPTIKENYTKILNQTWKELTNL